MTTDDILAEFQKNYEADGDWPVSPNAHSMDAWSQGSVADELRIYDEAAATLAKKYAAKELSFEFCDWVANTLWGSMIVRGNTWSALLAEVYAAFDDGEWSHLGEWKTSDPIKDYTDPAIAEIVAKL